MRYEIREFLGAGGMGQVYRAYDPKLDREVALKLLRGPTDEVRDRALREARAQARVAHPNICQIFEVGEDDGKAFIAMQLVVGASLSEVADDLDLRRKVVVVRQVAEAVQAAHNRGLVHRDLKPSNVLLAADSLADGKDESESSLVAVPHPFVVDFGLARSHDAPQLTATGHLPGTPAYLAPELLLSGGGADRRSDVYGLGVILYELLAGRPPYEGDSSVEVLAQVVRAPPPSLRTLRPDLARDLCWIVDQCMDRDPQRRYGSARLLAEDLDRFLAGEPVLARPPRLGYRFGLWLARNRLLATVIAVSLLLGLVGGVRYTVDLQTERREAEEARDEAQQVSDFLIDLFMSADPGRNDGDEPTVREVLDRGAQRLESELDASSPTRIQLHNLFGGVYKRLGDYETAELHILQGMDATKEALGPGAPDTLIFLQNLADLRRRQGRLDEAAALFEQSLEGRRRHGLETAKSSLGLAVVYTDQSRFEEGRSALAEALEASRALGDRDDEYLVLAEWGRLEREAGNLEAAADLFTQALEALGEEGKLLRRGTLLNNIGMLHHELGNPEAAIEHFERSIEVRRALHGDVHPTLASSLTNLGRSARQVGRFELAEESYEEVLEIYAQTLEPNHFWVAIARINLGRLLRETGRFEAARSELSEALSILHGASVSPSRTLAGQYNLALVDLDTGRLVDAESALREIRATSTELFGAESQLAVAARSGLGECARRRGRFDQALEHFREVETRYAAKFGDDSARLARFRVRLAETLAASGDSAESEAVARSAVDRLRHEVESRPADPALAAALAAGLGVLASFEADETTRVGRAEEGLAWLERLPVEDSAIDWLVTRAELLELARRSEEARALRDLVQATGYDLGEPGPAG